MNTIRALLVCLFLGACSGQQVVVREKHVVVVPETAMFNCPTVTQYPRAKTLTDVQTGLLLRELALDLRTCKNSMDAVQKFLLDSKKTVEKEAR